MRRTLIVARTFRDRRAISSSSVDYRRGAERSYQPTAVELQEMYRKKADHIRRQFRGRATNRRAVFTNSDMSLRYVDVYGFDYDFTLVQYNTVELIRLIYNQSKKRLIKSLSYPPGLQKLEYQSDFVIRGLHLDIKHGLLMKMDANHHIQLGSVYRGHMPLSNAEVAEIYGGTHVPLNIMDDSHHRSGMEKNPDLVQFLDTFSLAEISLFADISDFLMENKLPFDPEYLFTDVKINVKEVHKSGKIHKAIVTDPNRYIVPNPRIEEFLNGLKKAGKMVFLLTNSPFWFVNHGMCHMTGSQDWKDLFDVIITSARKPNFYGGANRPFRALDPKTLAPSWQQLTELQPGTVHEQGNIREFVKLTSWKGSSVLYIGDHVYSDLSDPNLQLGWKTGAIIPELEDEIVKGNSAAYKNTLASLLAVDAMLDRHQGYTDPQLLGIIESWKKERDLLRESLKIIYNGYFGSIFRTAKGATYFSRRLSRFANLYMSRLDNLMDYSLDHTFYPRRASLPHEPDLNFDFHDDLN